MFQKIKVHLGIIAVKTPTENMAHLKLLQETLAIKHVFATVWMDIKEL